MVITNKKQAESEMLADSRKKIGVEGLKDKAGMKDDSRRLTVVSLLLLRYSSRSQKTGQEAESASFFCGADGYEYGGADGTAAR